MRNILYMSIYTYLTSKNLIYIYYDIGNIYYYYSGAIKQILSCCSDKKIIEVIYYFYESLSTYTLAFKFKLGKITHLRYTV